MAQTFDPEIAVRTLSQTDPALKKLIQRAGPPTLNPPARLNVFEALLRSIVYQQLSGKAAATIHGRVKALFPGRTIRPEHLLATSDETLRSAGMSRAKAIAAKDLAQKVLDGIVPSGAQARKLSDEALIAHLTQVRGIGEWTVQMLLMFQLGRPDVLPVKDLGVRKGFMLTYKLPDLPTEKALMAHGESWRPYRSVASWYMWRAVEIYGK